MDKDHISGVSKDQIRGLMREYRSKIDEFLVLTEAFPESEDPHSSHYWHVRLPRSLSFLDSSETPAAIRRLCIQAIIDRVQHLIDVRSASEASARVVAEINLPKLSDSGIVVFFDANHFNELFSFGSEERRWKPLHQNRSLEKEWVLSMSGGLSMVGYQEEIGEGDYLFVREVWFIGELD